MPAIDRFQHPGMLPLGFLALLGVWAMIVSIQAGFAETREQRLDREIREIEFYGGNSSVRHSNNRGSTGKAESRRSGKTDTRKTSSTAGQRNTKGKGVGTRGTGKGDTQRTQKGSGRSSTYRSGSVRYSGSGRGTSR